MFMMPCQLRICTMCTALRPSTFFGAEICFGCSSISMVAIQSVTKSPSKSAICLFLFRPICNIYRLFDKISVLKYHCVNLECFHEFVSAHPCFLAPLLAAQHHLQCTVLGEWAWHSKTLYRQHSIHTSLNSLREILLGTSFQENTGKSFGQNLFSERTEESDHNDICSGNEPKYYMPQQDESSETVLYIEPNESMALEPRCFLCLYFRNFCEKVTR